MTAHEDSVRAGPAAGEDEPEGLEALSAQVGDSDRPSDGGEEAASGSDDDAVLDLEAMVHSSLQRPAQPEAGPEQASAQEPLDGRSASPSAAAPSRPVEAPRSRLGHGIAVGFALGLAAGWGLFAGLAAPAAPSTPSDPLRPPAALQEAVSAPGAQVAAAAVVAADGPPRPEPEPPETAAPVDRPQPSAPSRKRPAVRGRSARPRAADAPSVAVPAAGQPKSAPAAKPAPAAEPAPAGPPDEQGMDALLDRALSTKPGTAPSPEPDKPALPQSPTKQDVGAAIRVLIPAISGCAAGQKGVAVVSLVVRNNGRVASARVSGAPFEGTPAGRCMEGVVRKARFSPFLRPTFRVRLPLKIE